MRRIACIIVALVAGLSLCGGAANAQTVAELKKQLAAKDAEIARLRGEVQQLKSTGAPALRPIAQPTYVPPPPPPTQEVAEEDRALEQALVREGALVLAPRTYELTPTFSWAHSNKVEEPLIENSFSVGGTFTMGLPWRSQVSLGLPYVWDDLRNGETSQGLGDAGVLFSKELISEGPHMPAVLGQVGWTSPTSRACCFGPIPWVSGFQGGLTASKRLDPLVAFAGVSYYSQISSNVAGTTSDPENIIGTRLGASLAVTPTTSITTGVHLSFITNPSAENLPVRNSDDVLTSVDIGFNTLLWHQTFLNVTGQFGLTGDIPEFRIITSVPIVF
jgi:hypothetical protein